VSKCIIVCHISVTRGFDTATAGKSIVICMARADWEADLIQWLARAARGHEKIAEGFLILVKALTERQ